MSKEFLQRATALPQEMIDRFSEAVATGRWDDGTLLSDEQKEVCIQAIMLHQATQNDVGEAFSVTASGELITGKQARAESSMPKRNAKEIERNLIIETTNKK